jgi:uncharacterized lipoprotein YddW (UPF0748 family)
MSLGLLVGCQPPRMTGPIRAVWVTRFDYKTPEDVSRIIDNCKQVGFNTVIWQVRGNATAFYPSKIEPWAEQFDFKDPGFDPLALACREAHDRKMQIHAWANVVPGWRGTKPPSDPRQVYNAHPEWFWYDQHGKRQPLTSFYVSLNPCLPEVREYIVSVFREIVTNYDLDGLHMDYIRFPSEPPAIPAGSGIDYPRDEKTLALYKKATGLTPDENTESWKRWRTEQVTQLVADIHDMMRQARPRAALSAAVGAERAESLAFFRDEDTWIKRKLIDGAFPMNYKRDLATFKTGLTRWLPPGKEIPLIPGMWFDDRLKGEEGVSVARQQIEYAIANTGNVCVFAYASLFTTGEVERGRQATTTAPARPNAREMRRRMISDLFAQPLTVH